MDINSNKINSCSDDVFKATTTACSNNNNNNNNNNINNNNNDNDTANVVFQSPSNESSSSSYRRTMSSSDKLNSTIIYCRICHEDESLEELVDPCKCAGSLGLIHASCLEKWLSTSNTDRCEICKYVFTIQRKNKPIAQWWRSSSVHGPRGIAGDAICLMILTPLCIAATYLCALGASAYSRLGYWEGTGLAVLCSLLIFTYCLWLIITLRFHYKLWKSWRKQNQDVVLLVKHKVDSPPVRQIQDKNNNRGMAGYDIPQNRFFFTVSFSHEEDPTYVVHQQTSFV